MLIHRGPKNGHEGANGGDGWGCMNLSVLDRFSIRALDGFRRCKKKRGGGGGKPEDVKGTYVVHLAGNEARRGGEAMQFKVCGDRLRDSFYSRRPGAFFF